MKKLAYYFVFVTIIAFIVTGCKKSHYESKVNNEKKISSDTIHYYDSYDLSSTHPRYVTRSKWNKNNLTYQITNYPNNLGQYEVNTAIIKAFDTWSNYTNLIFTRVLSDADIKISWAAIDQGGTTDANGITRNILAHASYPSSGILEFDNYENWSANENWTFGIDLQTVALHEIGHILGLAHEESDNCATMFPTYRSGTTQRFLAPDDINGVRSLYGAKGVDNSFFNIDVLNGSCTNDAVILSVIGLPTINTISWSSSNPEIATIANNHLNQGVISRIGNAKGSVTFSAQVSLLCGLNLTIRPLTVQIGSSPPIQIQSLYVYSDQSGEVRLLTSNDVPGAIRYEFSYFKEPYNGNLITVTSRTGTAKVIINTPGVYKFRALAVTNCGQSNEIYATETIVGNERGGER